MLSVFNYLDYRRFLKDFYEYRKAKDNSYSYRVFLNKAGITSPSFLKQIISGDRNLTPSTIEKFLSPLHLNKKEAEFFRTLVHFNQAKTTEERNLHYKTLREFARSKKIPIIGEDAYDYYEFWYTSALREILCMYPISTPDTEIAQKIYPPITAYKVKKAKKCLLDLKMIEKKGNRYVQTHQLISTGSEVNSMMVREFNGQMLDKAKQALRVLPTSERNIQGITMGISKNTYNLITEEMERFQSRVMDLIGMDSAPDRVYQLNFQLIPLTRESKG